MPLNPRGARSQYNPVASTESHDEDDHDDSQQNETGSSNSKSRPRGRRRPTLTTADSEYTPVLAAESTSTTTSLDVLEEEEEEKEDEKVNVVIMDAAQKRFPMSVHPNWTIGKFKEWSAKIHKVAASQQRLIFRGKMLEDSKTLKEAGIHQNDVIVHLFPKPRVVLTSTTTTTTSNSNNQDGTSSVASLAGTTTSDDAGDEEMGGAHVPQIVLDPEEQQRRGQILVLGSHEVLEAQSNVRLLSMLLFVISLMRLLALFSIATGSAQEYVYEDDLIPPSPDHTNHTNPYIDPNGEHGEGTYEIREWQTTDYYDLVVHVVCFFVALLGCRATNENTSFLARAYLGGTILAGILWNIWNVYNYALFVDEETSLEQNKDDDEVIPLTTDDFVTVAFFTLILPVMLWISCCARAHQFRLLIEEAEQEAAERIQSQLQLVQEAAASGSSSSEDANVDNDNGNDMAVPTRELTELHHRNSSSSSAENTDSHSRLVIV